LRIYGAQCLRGPIVYGCAARRRPINGQRINDSRIGCGGERGACGECYQHCEALGEVRSTHVSSLEPAECRSRKASRARTLAAMSETTALVTGASGGIGAAICQLLAARGATIILHYHADRAAAEAVRRELPGTAHALLQADLGDAAQLSHTWLELAAHRRIDVLVNNAGIFPDHPPLTTAYADWTAAWQQTLATNLVAAAHLSYCAAQAMVQAGGGRIVSVSSRAAFRGEPTAPAYAASKAGLNAFSQSLAKALAPQGVYVFVVAPGWVATQRVSEAVNDRAVLADQPLGRVATPQEVAEVVAYCVLDAPVSMTGAIVDVNGASYLRT